MKYYWDPMPFKLFLKTTERYVISIIITLAIKCKYQRTDILQELEEDIFVCLKGDCHFHKGRKEFRWTSHVDFWYRDLRNFPNFLPWLQKTQNRRGTESKKTSASHAHVTWKEFSLVLKIILTSLSLLKFLSDSP